jgi:hypothetical protein
VWLPPALRPANDFASMPITHVVNDDLVAGMLDETGPFAEVLLGMCGSERCLIRP